MIRIITIEREYGCGAGAIAKEIAKHLHWKLWDERQTREIAKLAHCELADVSKREERRDPLYYGLFKSFAVGSYEGSPDASSVEMLDADSIVRLSEQVVQRAADEGNCVIVGRGSQHFLRNRTDTLRFFLYAARKVKIHRLTAEGRPESLAEQLISPLIETARRLSVTISMPSDRTVRCITPC
jgi:cytidylate kinase